MTAAELARFRARLQEQAAAAVGDDPGLFARMRARLTVVEGDGASAPAEPRDLRAPALRVVAGSAPGVIAGWSRARPPSARRRLLGRVEVVLRAEIEGLDARRAAEDSPSPA